MKSIPSYYYKFAGSGICKIVAISVPISYLICICVFNYPSNPASVFFSSSHLTWAANQPSQKDSSTNISHIVFGLLGSVKTWRERRPYIEAWWRPNVTRGSLYMDVFPTHDLLPWPSSCPPFRVSDNISVLLKEVKHVEPFQVRMDHAVVEVFRDVHEGVRWYVMGDDDTIFFLDNLVDVLAEYDHKKYIYIGDQSESLMSDFIFSFNMGFGGGGLILSYPLAQAVAKSFEGCIKRPPYFTSADQILMSCVAELGVSFTAYKGIHQIDLVGDLSGFLLSHPQVPLVSLHHFGKVDPIFPSLNRFESVNHLMKAANVDQSRLLQQTICYQKQRNWSFSISWGYSAHIYEKVIPRSILQMPLETFKPWFRNTRPPYYNFNTRPWPTKDPCEAPHIFFFDTINKISNKDVISSYIRSAKHGVPACFSSGNHSADSVNKIKVFSPATKLDQSGRSECCDIAYAGDTDMVEVKLRNCMKDEIIA